MDVLLSNGAFVFEVNSLGQTPLHLASSFGHNEVIKALIKAGANVKVMLCLKLKQSNNSSKCQCSIWYVLCTVL